MGLRAELEAFKRTWDSKVESVPEKDPLWEMLQENVGLGEHQTTLVDLLEAIDLFDSESDKESKEDLVMTSGSLIDESLHEDCFGRSVQIPGKEEGEVGHNIGIEDLKPSLYFSEMKEEELEVKCLELPGYIIEFEKAPVIELPRYLVEFEEALTLELPGYILEFEESPMFKFPPSDLLILGEVGGIEAKIDYDRLRRESPPTIAELDEWDTYLWDPGGC